MNRSSIVIAVLGLVFARLGCAAHPVAGRLLAAGPAWEVDIAQVTGHSATAVGAPHQAANAVYVPRNAHWTTYVIRDADTTYICREKVNVQPVWTPNQPILFKVSGSRLIWETTSGERHIAHLVIR